MDEYWFENLNLRGSYKPVILEYVSKKYPKLEKLYDDIYNKHDRTYWQDLAEKINAYCKQHKIKFQNFFYHEEIKKK